MAVGTIGTTTSAMATPRPCSRSQRMTPSVDDRPKAEPPERQIASIASTRHDGSSRSVSRVPGAPPRTSTEATDGRSHSTTLTPERRRWSSSLPTRMPSTSVMRFLEPGRSMVYLSSRARARDLEGGSKGPSLRSG